VRRNQGFIYRETVEPAAPGETVLDYLARRYPHSTQTTWRTRIARRQVRLDGVAVTPDAALGRGQTLTWQRPPWDEPDAPRFYSLIYEDDDLVVVAKPAGLPTLPGAGFLESTLLALVRRRYPTAAPMHRLGRWTSGLVACGRTPAARAALAAQWRRGLVIKRYRALAAGRPAWSRRTITAPIGRIPYAPLGRLHAVDPDGRPARSEVEVIERREDAFLAEVTIATGRPHQIRIHLAWAGHPLVGDPLYGHGGRPDPDSTALPGDPGYRLHALELRLRQPSSGKPIDLRCDAPPVLRPELENATDTRAG